MDGIGDYTRILVGVMRERGADVSVIASGRYSGSDPGVFKVGHSDNWGLAELSKTLKIIKNSRFDVVHMQYTPVSYGFGVVFKFLPLLVRIISPGTLFVTTFHTLVGGKSISKINALALSLSSHTLISTNDEITFLFRKWFPFCVRKLHQVPIASNVEVHDVDPLEAREKIRAKYEISKDAIIIGNFGFAYPGKGLEDLVSALGKLEAGGGKYYLMFMGAERKGQDEYRCHIKELVRMRGLEENVIWTGELTGESLAEHLRSCDIYAVPYSDGISTRRGSLMTAIDYGLTVISTHPRLRSLYFRHEKNVLLVNPGDPKSLAVAIRNLASNRILREKLSANISRLSGVFRWDSIAERTLNIYYRKEKRDRTLDNTGMTTAERIRYFFKIVVETLEFTALRAIAGFVIKGRHLDARKGTPRRILFVQMNSIGDAVMSIPALRALKDVSIEREICVVSSGPAAHIFKLIPDIKRVYEISPRFWRKIFSSPADVKRSISSIMQIRSRKFDICVDMGGTVGSIPVVLLSGSSASAGPLAAIRSGLRVSDTGIFYNKAVETSSEHISGRYLEIIGPLGRSSAGKKLSLAISSETMDSAGMYLEQEGLDRGAFAVIHPGAKWPPKRWPAEYFAALIGMLESRKTLRTVLIGTAGEKDLLSRIKTESGVDDVVVSTELDLERTAALISLARVFIGNDSGPAHIAAATGIPSVVIFGPTEARSCGPLSERTAAVEASMFCRPCTLYFSRDRCQMGENICLKELNPEKVFDKVGEVLTGHGD